jgi:DNA-binding transcriptional LysR family regulator
LKIEYLRNFIKLIQYKSFSQLARELEISQSTLSHQISQIEKEFGGVILIDRTTKKFELSKAGILLKNHAEQIIELYENCKLEISKFVNEMYEDIIISASTIPGSHVLPRYIANFRSKNDHAKFKIGINNSKKSLENLKNGMANFAAIGSFMGYQTKDFDYFKIGDDKLKIICSPNHVLAKEGNIVSLDDIKGNAFVSREKGSGTRATLEQQFSEYNKLNIELEFNDNDSIISTVSESNYLSIMSEIIATKAESAGLVKILNVKDYPYITKRPLYFARLKGKELSRLKMKFWDELRTQVVKK